jgi:beta-aspartyl-peptidase (threonine type)
MKRLLVLPAFALAATLTARAASAPPAKKPFGLVMHGGAGVILRKDLTPEVETQYLSKLAEARDAGYAILEKGGSALDAVVATITLLEDSPLFNAGRGAVFSAEGICELDASIMDGRTQAAGAVARITHIQNPIALARAVMEKSEHVLLTGDGAEKFAQQQGFNLVSNEFFRTDFRKKQLDKAKEREAKEREAKEMEAEKKPSVRLAVPRAPGLALSDDEYFDKISKYGTVGCVALDRTGNLAAGTSTGGMTNKRFGRIGDTPLIGAGTYANNATCAVSATGWGEFFIRLTVAHDIAAQMEYGGATLSDAASATMAKVAKLGGDGGVVCIDKDGKIALPFNSPGMYRGYKLSTGASAIQIFGEK